MQNLLEIFMIIGGFTAAGCIFVLVICLLGLLVGLFLPEEKRSKATPVLLKIIVICLLVGLVGFGTCLSVVLSF